MQKWEYKVIKDWPEEYELDELGDKGWELVAVAAAGHDSTSDYVYAYLKRPLNQPEPEPETDEYDEDYDTRSPTW